MREGKIRKVEKKGEVRNSLMKREMSFLSGVFLMGSTLTVPIMWSIELRKSVEKGGSMAASN